MGTFPFGQNVQLGTLLKSNIDFNVTKYGEDGLSFLKILFKIILVIFLVCFSIGIFGVGSGYDMYKEALNNMPLSQKVEEIKSDDNYITIDKLPKIYLDAVVAVEDHRFYEHFGIDVIAIGRAIINDIKAFSLVEGGSTITQQLSKNIYFTQEKSFIRKIAEAFMAFNIERNYSKDKILELYVNTSYFGDGYTGIREASLGYFRKEPQNLSDSESVMLAGIPNSPSNYSPIKNPQLVKKRQKQVLDRMVKYNYIKKEEANKIYY